MAQPIKETPVLTGRDARRFEQDIKKNENKRISSKEFEKAKKIFEQVKSKSSLEC